MWWIPIDYAVPSGWPIFVLAFLDGSADSHIGRQSQRYVALACIGAYKTAWDEHFAPEWDRLIQRNDGNGIHAVELFRDGKFGLLGDAVNVIARLQSGLHRFGCVIDLSDYRRAVPLCPRLHSPQHDPRPPKRPEAVCVDWCVGHLFGRLEYDYETQVPADIGLVFDRNESFLRWINRVWTAPNHLRPFWARKRQRGDWLTPLIGTIVPGDSDRYRELQAADVIAWTLIRHYTVGDREDWHEAIKSNCEANFKFYNFKRLLVRYAPNRETIDDNINDDASTA